MDQVSVTYDRTNRLVNIPRSVFKELPKEKVLSVRVPGSLYAVLENQAEEWGNVNVGETVRTILSLYFLPYLLVREGNDKAKGDTLSYVKELAEVGSLDPEKVGLFVPQALTYLRFLKQAEELNKEVGLFLSDTIQLMESII